jgi:hypothetical protein
MLTYDAVRAGAPRLDRLYTTHDGRTVDSAGAFLVQELERLDPALHMPLAAVTWGRDIDLREDVTLADESASLSPIAPSPHLVVSLLLVSTGQARTLQRLLVLLLISARQHSLSCSGKKNSSIRSQNLNRQSRLGVQLISRSLRV